MKSLPNLILDASKDPMKQTMTHKMTLKQPQNGARLNLEPAPINNKNKTKEKHMKGEHPQR